MAVLISDRQGMKIPWENLEVFFRWVTVMVLEKVVNHGESRASYGVAVWGFPESIVGYPQNNPLLDGIFYYKPSSYGDTPFMDTSYVFWSREYSDVLCSLICTRDDGINWT